MPKRIILTLVIVLAVINVNGQLTENDTLRFGYKLGITGSWIKGNVERLIINNNIDVSHVGKMVALKTSTNYIYGTIYQTETENDVFSRNFIYLNPRKRFYPYAMLWIQHSQRQQIQFRHQVGIGGTFTLVHHSKHLLKISGTLTQETTKYNGKNFTVTPENLKGSEVSKYRGTVRLLASHLLANNKLKLHYETWYQPAIGDPSNWRYFLNASLDFFITKLLSFRSSVLYTHENIVLSTIKKDDQILTFGLSISNY